jgi:hypothetical protein
LSEMAFSKSSLPLLLGPFINSFIMICESVRESGWIYYCEKCCYQNIDYRYSSFEINWVFLVGGQNYFPPL